MSRVIDSWECPRTGAQATASTAVRILNLLNMISAEVVDAMRGQRRPDGGPSQPVHVGDGAPPLSAPPLFRSRFSLASPWSPHTASLNTRKPLSRGQSMRYVGRTPRRFRTGVTTVVSLVLCGACAADGPRGGSIASGSDLGDAVEIPIEEYAARRLRILEDLPGGTSIVTEFRGASIVDTVDPQANNSSGPWRAFEDGFFPVPNFVNFALDPLKAGDAHIRKFDDRPSSFTGGASRNWWTYFYNRTVTTYTESLNTLMDPIFTKGFAGPLESFLPDDVKYFNWRFLMNNNVEASPSISPSIDTFMVSYRFEKVR